MFRSKNKDNKIVRKKKNCNDATKEETTIMVTPDLLSQSHRNPQTPPSSPLQHPKQPPPLVILAGWLGCKEKSLRRYAAMYKELFKCNNCTVTVLIKIASPSMIVHASSSQLYKDNTVHGTIDNVNTNMDTTNGSNINNINSFHSIHQLAVETLEDVRCSNCKYFFLHVFSNGGCFLWEAMYHIMKKNLSKSKRTNQNVHTDYNDIASKLRGIIYDSSPSDYSCGRENLLFQALEYCSPHDKVDANRYLLQRRIQLQSTEKNSEEYDLLEQRERKQRALDYWHRMRVEMTLEPINNTLQYLYIYSKNDEVTPYKSLDDLVTYQKNEFIPNIKRVRRFVLEDSKHCSHLLSDPIRYKHVIANFLHHCINNNNRYDAINFHHGEGNGRGLTELNNVCDSTNIGSSSLSSIDNVVTLQSRL